MVMQTKFDLMLVVLSYVVAIFASYVGLTLAQSVTRSTGRRRFFWLCAGSLALGFGIWSMHFVGMLAFEMPGMQMAYDIPLMILSVVVAIAGSALALVIVSRPRVPNPSLVSGGVAMAAAIAGMHYIGMYSMRMSAVIHWDIFLVVLSVVIALVASFGALHMLVRFRDKEENYLQLVITSLVMGFAIAGMHYTGMLAATFVHEETIQIHNSSLMVSSGLTTAVIAAALIILGVALATAILQRIWDSRTRAAADVLGKSEQRFRLLVEAVKDYAIIMLDPHGHITTWNAGAKRITGYSDDEVIGKHVSMFYTDTDAKRDMSRIELQAAQQFGHFEGEGVRLRKDGSAYWANVVISPLIGENGTLTGFSKITRDITAVKEAERVLKQANEDLEERVRRRTVEVAQSEQQLRTITRAVPVLIAQADVNERLTFANEAFTNWFDLTPETALGCSMRQVLGSDRYPMNQPYIARALKGETVTYERVSKNLNQEAVLNITFVPEMDSAGAVNGFVIVASDITRHKEIQKELEKAKEAAEVANSTKSAFLANMSHEIRTPLGAVLGFSELLVNGQLTDTERVESAEVIQRNGLLLSNVINDILDLSKVEAGKLEIEKVTVPFNEIIKDLSSLLSLEALKKGIRLNVTTAGEIPSAIVTDPLRLRQILINIVGNAIKFTHRGSVDVLIKVTQNEGPRLAFIVKDTGEGIDAAQSARLFEPFQQADVSITRKFGGTGLGLILSRKLAAALGGDVRLVESRLGHGSTFLVLIDPGVALETVAVKKSSRPAGKSTLEGLKILVVDDSLDNQALIKTILKHSGAEVETVSNGAEAVEAATRGNFDIILMDLQMPVMDGFEATRVLRDNGYKKPIVALTAHAMKEERERTLNSGFNDHLTKPIDQRELVRTLGDHATT